MFEVSRLLGLHWLHQRAIQREGLHGFLRDIETIDKDSWPISNGHDVYVVNGIVAEVNLQLYSCIITFLKFITLF